MQRECDVCESVCEAGVLVHGVMAYATAARVICASVRSVCVCVCVCVLLAEASRATISREQEPNKLSLIPTPFFVRTVLR